MKVIFILLQFASLLYLSVCVNLECDFLTRSDADYPPIGAVYTCELRNTLNIISPEITIDSISTNHTGGKSHDDVQGIYDQQGGRNIQYFPRGLDKFFKNIIYIDLNNGRIKEISQDDLKVFPLLEALDLYYNDIEVIEAGLFDFNPNLKVIWLTIKIVHIETNVFDNLSKLSYLFLQNNPCINKNVVNSTSNVISLAQEAYTKCIDLEYSSLNQKLIDLESEPKLCETLPSVKERLANLEIEIQNSKFSYLTSFKRRIEAEYLILENETVEKCTKSCENNLDDIKNDVAELNTKIDNLEILIKNLIADIQNKCGAIGECVTKMPETTTTTTEVVVTGDAGDEDVLYEDLENTLTGSAN